ncbi:non-ribosomal peptide synthetase [Pelagibaculum spongiae]|uniref:Carrier domain-containing protein n=1 Tax=Pelagibaculum spongiae TaxID=2080658 RepID=A0A2V1H0S4_9GAMM|nr:non-ribosomal peptide synthetase [Pelagibaculum spongiae]PVZ68899.1 hypothetical protein DC094_11645 [Pelagibaculum spongiae]
MSAQQLLESLRQKGVKVWLEADKIKLDAPQGAIDAALFEQLKANKAQLTDLLRADSAAEVTKPAVSRKASNRSAMTIQVGDYQQGWQLSPLQHRLWLHQQINPSDTSYNMLGAWDIAGDLQPQLMLQAFEQLIERQHILSSCIRAQASHGFAEKSRQLFKLQQIDFSALSESKQQLKWQTALQQQSNTPFVLEQQLPIRAVLAKFANNRWSLSVCLHHVVADGWSIACLIDQLSQLYSQQTLPELQYQYSDYARWQNAQLADAAANNSADDKAFWSNYLQNIEPLELPSGLNAAQQSRQSAKAGQLKLKLDPIQLQQLQQFASEQGTTLYLAAVSVFQTLLYRYSEHSDITLISPITDRPDPALTNLIGCFINTLPFRSNVTADLTFKQLLQRNLSYFENILQHQHLPFDQLQQALNQQGSSLESAEKAICFVVQNAPSSQLTLNNQNGAALKLTAIDIANQAAKFGLTLQLFVDPQAPYLELEYHPQMLSEMMAQRLVQHFSQLITVMVADPDKPLGKINYLNQAEQKWLLAQDGPKNPYPDCSLVERFERAAKKYPQNTALTFENQSLNYQDLLLQVNGLADWLLEQKLIPGDRVALYLPRSIELVMTTLGLARAGLVAVPLDPTYPVARLQQMANQAEVTALLIGDQDLEFAPELRRIELPHHDFVQTILAREQSKTPFPAADDSLYIMFTSGSTGVPKGIEVSHQNVMRLACNNTFANTGSGVSVLQYAPVAFDASTFEIWNSLLNGARLVIAPAKTLSASELGQLISEQKIDVLWLTAALFHQLVDQNSEIFSGVTQLLTGGDVVSASRVKSLLKKFPKLIISNGYGPTENTTFTTVHHLKSAEQVDTPLPIGKPIANTSVRVLDPRGMPVAIGIAGELWAGGGGVAKGYINAADLTAKAFVSQTTSSQAQIWYRTGDLVSWREDGVLNYHGRIDQQVKIRGFRIEPAEIEQQINRLPGVKNCCVLPVKDPRTTSDERMLACWLETESFDDFQPEQWREQLKQSLSIHMVPQSWNHVECLPINANGKLDRKALPEPQLSSTVAPAAIRVAENDQQQKMLRIWQPLLTNNQLGIDDDFFLLGGHSLLVTRLVSEIARVFSIELPINLIYRYPTVAQLCDQLHQGKAVDLIEKQADTKLQPLSMAQKQLWFLQKLQSVESHGQASNNYNVLAALELTGTVDQAALQASLDWLINRHSILRATFTEVDQEPCQKIGQQVSADFQLLDLSQQADAQASLQQFLQRLSQQAIDLNNPEKRLFNSWLVKLSDQKQVLVLLTHHILADGWSMGLLVEELSQTYTQLLQLPRNNLSLVQSELNTPALEFADFSIWQQQWLDSPKSQPARDYWLSQLQEAPVLQLPYDKARPARLSSAGADFWFTIPAQQTTALQQLANQLQVSLYSLLLTIYRVQLYRYSRQTDFAIGTPVAGRLRPELEKLVGMFVNSLPMRMTVDAQQSFQKMAQQQHQITIDAWQHQQLPLQTMVDQLQLDRNASQSPIFQVMFALQNSTDDFVADFAGLDCQVLKVPNPVAKFELSLHLQKNADGGMDGRFEYATDLFKAERMAQFSDHFSHLIAQVIAQPEISLNQLQLLNSSRLSQVAEHSNPVKRYQIDDSLCLADIFTASAAKFPEHTALTLPGFKSPQDSMVSWSYCQLDQKSGQLASAIQALGVQPGQPVAILLDRGLDLPLAILSVLKAGCWYVPLDPSSPKDRVDFIVEDSGCDLLISHSDLTAQWPDQKQVIALDQLELPQQQLRLSMSADDTAYMIYTSGTTGKPKGVKVSHRNVIRLFMSAAEDFEFSDKDVWSLFHSCAFDFSVWEIWGAWFHGGELLVVPWIISRDTQTFRTLLQQHNVSVLNQTPSAFVRLIQEDQIAGDKLEALRYVVFGGEALDCRSLKPWTDKYSLQTPQLVNMYGITETTVHVTYYPIEQSNLNQLASPIGRPLSDLGCWLLDCDGQPVDQGLPGELYVSGSGVTQGYHQRDSLNQQRFITKEFADGCLYRSGDLVKRNGLGQLEYLGRIDEQIKLRGFRIELGEIRSQIESIVGIHQAVVKVIGEGDQQRLACWVMLMNQDITQQAICDYLLKNLPEYMVPSLFVLMDQLPLTANGKVDSKALPDPDSMEVSTTDHQLPLTETEIRLAEIWSELLDQKAIARDGHFFRLGGHSLLATKAVSRIRDRLAIELSLADFFDVPVLQQQAHKLDQLIAASNIQNTAQADSITKFELAEQELNDVDALLGELGELGESGELDQQALEALLGEVEQQE